MIAFAMPADEQQFIHDVHYAFLIQCIQDAVETLPLRQVYTRTTIICIGLVDETKVGSGLAQLEILHARHGGAHKIERGGISTVQILQEIAGHRGKVDISLTTMDRYARGRCGSRRSCCFRESRGRCKNSAVGFDGYA